MISRKVCRIFGTCTALYNNIAIKQNLPDLNDKLDRLSVQDDGVEDNFIFNGDFNNDFLTRDNIVAR